MSNDKFFNKRKAKSKKSLKRLPATKEIEFKCLIVCEGSKSEPYYFEGLRSYANLKSVNIVVDGSCDSSPNKVLAHANSLYRKSVRDGDVFDKVYCVIDRDAHETFEVTIDAISRINPKKVYEAVTSIPSFEYWLLLHFIPATKPYHAIKGKSAGDQVFDDLVAVFPEYSKGKIGVFSALLEKLPQALVNLEMVTKTMAQSGTDNPSTNVGSLVSKLLSNKKH